MIFKIATTASRQDFDDRIFATENSYQQPISSHLLNCLGKTVL